MKMIEIKLLLSKDCYFRLKCQQKLKMYLNVVMEEQKVCVNYCVDWLLSVTTFMRKVYSNQNQLTQQKRVYLASQSYRESQKSTKLFEYDVFKTK